MRRNKKCLRRILEGKVTFSSGYPLESKDDLKKWMIECDVGWQTEGDVVRKS